MTDTTVRDKIADILNENTDLGECLFDVADAIMAALPELTASQWLPIETAESGESYLVYAHGYVITATKIGTHWMNKGEEIFPTHLMPLPAAPALVTQGEE
jgi:hypothetical protein